MLKTTIITAALALSLAATGSVLAAAPSDHRANMLRQCNKQVEKLKDYTWGDEQFDRYRACMAEHGQPE